MNMKSSLLHWNQMLRVCTLNLTRIVIEALNLSISIKLFLNCINVKFNSQQQDVVEMEAGPVARPVRRRKTSQNDHSHGSFFLRIGAIGKTI